MILMISCIQKGTSTQRKAPAFTMRGRSERADGKNDVVPAPGAYDLPDPQKVKTSKSPSYSMATRRNGGGDDGGGIPGPGAYGAPAAKKKSGPKYSFGISSQQPSSQTVSPGPIYNLPSRERVGEGPQYSFGGGGGSRPIASGKSQSPGPVYQLPSSISSGPKIAFSKANRDASNTSNTPGPMYNPKLGKGPHFSFGLKLKTGAMDGKNDSPGPGAYSVRSKIGEGPRYSIKARRMPGDMSARSSRSSGARKSRPKSAAV
mmetsp:Transcript_7766/g.20203  ORF Transcript_7766/g.20203 Transcript_7766/m.20203 type:complete len:260 (-) Transcript_7766:1523-2302(-)